ncbi:TonB-dependent receptor plug domain-containing protein, partial [Polymorphobacter sp.]|uniref:TonB-dependent receptor plug domain-containing protein n=1 Tax=Polymorphobacter sp. TaxID=1909290 RepID=UPI003F6E6927
MINDTRTHVRHGISAMAIAVMFISAPAMSQSVGNVEAPQGDDSDQIVVTGSRIRGAAPVGSAVIALDNADLVQSGAVTTAQALQELPQVFNLGISENARGQAGGSGNVTYGTAINLRGIGPFATLTLVNGHRLPNSGTLGQAVDPSVIPTVALRTVEVVADGASAIYGSDAVAGVVNLIMRNDFEGLEVRGRYGFADAYDERQISVLAGHKWDTGSVTIAYEHAYQSGLNGQDRDFFRSDLTRFGGRD